ncbi:MAG: hypothetical protein J1F39_06050 [Clostridiales bacterium]|nr:hypothetical protein [Clostridiales bacterium]
MRFCDAVIYYGGSASYVNTPALGDTGCGLSVKCDDYSLCYGVYNRGNYSGLKGVYEFDGFSYKPIYNAGN